MPRRPTYVSGIQRPENIDRIRRRLQREAQQIRIELDQVQDQAQPNLDPPQPPSDSGEDSSYLLLDQHSQSPSEDQDSTSDSSTMANQDDPPRLPTLLKLADTNPFTNLSNITTENGRRLWRQATEPLSDKFDGTHQNFQNFYPQNFSVPSLTMSCTTYSPAKSVTKVGFTSVGSDSVAVLPTGILIRAQVSLGSQPQ